MLFWQLSCLGCVPVSIHLICIKTSINVSFQLKGSSTNEESKKHSTSKIDNSPWPWPWPSHLQSPPVIRKNVDQTKDAVDRETIDQSDIFESNSNTDQTLAVSKIINNNIEVYIDGQPKSVNDSKIIFERAGVNKNFTTPIVLYQNDLFEANSNRNQTITVSKTITNNIVVHRYSNAKNDQLNIQHIEHQSIEFDDDVNKMVAIDGDDEFEVNSNTNQVGAVTKIITNNIKIFLTSKQNQ